MMGKPLSEWTKNRIAELAALDLPQTIIAQRLGISPCAVRDYAPKSPKDNKVYKIKNPQGEIHSVTLSDLKQFCALHNLTPQTLRGVIKKERKHHKGWTVA